MDKVLYKDFSLIDSSIGADLVDVAILRQSVNTIFRVWFLSKNRAGNPVRIMDEFQLNANRIISDSERFIPSALVATKNTNNTEYNLYYGTYEGEFHVFSDAIRPIIECFSSDAGIANGIELIQQITAAAAENRVKSADVEGLTAFSRSEMDYVAISDAMIDKGVKVGSLADNITQTFYVAVENGTNPFKARYTVDQLGGRKMLNVSYNATDADFPVAIVDDGTDVYIKFLKAGFKVYFNGIANKVLVDTSSFTMWTTTLDSVYPGQPLIHYAPYDVGHICYRTTVNRPYWWDGEILRDANGATIDAPLSGSVRPPGESIYVGFMFFDLSLAVPRPIWAKNITRTGEGTEEDPYVYTVTWVDALGNPVDTVYSKVLGTPTTGNLAKFNSTDIEDAGVAPNT